MSIADLRCSGSSGMATSLQSLTAFTQAFSWEQRCHYSVPQRTVQASKCIKRYSYSKVSNSYEAKDSSTKVNEKAREKLLIDCGPDQQCCFGGVAALGKFDALHVGHRELAIQASKIGAPFLLSFAGIAEVLGWERRLPIVANCDRKRVLALWAPLCGGMIPQEYQVQFSLVRHLSPRQFVEKLSNELGVKGVVAGANYRFGYKAAGDASDLVQLCGEYGLKAAIVDPVMDKTNRLVKEQKIVGVNPREKGQVSSTVIRSALAAGSMRRVNELLGRKHRLVLCSDDCNVSATSLVSNTANALNQFPFNGQYACTLVIGSMDKLDNHSFSNECMIGSAQLEITSDELMVTLDEGISIEKLNGTYYIGLDFEDCDAADAYTL